MKCWILCIYLMEIQMKIHVLLCFLHRHLHTPTNLLLLSLAVSDCMVGLLLSFQIMLTDGCWYLSDLMCVLYMVVDYTVTSASIGIMVIISIDRYVAICYPLHYTIKVTPDRAKLCVSLCWMFSILCSCLLLKDNIQQPGRYNSCSGECVVVFNDVAGVADLILSFIGPVTVIVVLYLRVFVVAVSQARTMRSHIASVTFQSSITPKKSEMKAAKSLGVVVAVFLTCLFPYFCVILTGYDVSLNASFIAFVICLFYFNSCLNPLIYSLFYPWFRKSVKLIVTLQIFKPGSCDISVV